MSESIKTLLFVDLHQENSILFYFLTNIMQHDKLGGKSANLTRTNLLSVCQTPINVKIPLKTSLLTPFTHENEQYSVIFAETFCTNHKPKKGEPAMKPKKKMHFQEEYELDNYLNEDDDRYYNTSSNATIWYS